MQNRQKLPALRALMKKHGADAYYVPSVDPHQSEYVPACWQRRVWLSGFTGSAGDLLVTARKAGLWTDSRYFLQAEAQLAGSGIELFRIGLPGVPTLLAHACRVLKKGQTLAVDPQVMSLDAADSFAGALSERGIEVKYLARNLGDALWTGRPAPSDAPVKLHGPRYSGESTACKLDRLRAAMKEHGARAHVIGALDVIAWLFNIRSRDIEFTPVVIAYAIVTERGATLYLDQRKVGKSVRKGLGRSVRIKSYEAVADDLRALGRRKLPVLVDPATTSKWVCDLLKSCDLVRATSPIVAMKAIKNEVQMGGIRAAHVRDGAAMVKFLGWLETAVPSGGVTEISASDRLTEFRAEQPGFQDNSFGPISGYAAHGAIVHYSATPESDVPLKPRGVYLIDSGAQYLDGTTDITRTVALGPVPRRAKTMFTLVLKGNINITRTPFPQGLSGQRLEILARQALLLHGQNYGHGTGHGVGHYLGVHEGPMSVSPRDTANVPLAPGQLLSIEPGHYEAGKFGIRIENLCLVVPDPKHTTEETAWYRWEPVTLCPIDLSMIDKDLLDPVEVDWLNAYHKRVYKKLAPLLDGSHRKWLKRATRSI
ncbi:aminopeptidase P family protein [bacterium]|nr:aminopeptidase P family protein [bacterium]MBU1072441.1 aminopeptidase P family protein [bacterium]MBU1677015.1 aminopeptidase P family protein [bacterium]